MTEYDYNNMPEEHIRPTLPVGFFDEAMAAFVEAVESGDAIAYEAKAAYISNRKMHMNFDGFGKPRNASYSSKTDDILLQLSIRIPNQYNTTSFPKTEALAKNVAEFALAAERSALEVSIAADEAAIAQAQAGAALKRQRLEALQAK